MTRDAIDQALQVVINSLPEIELRATYTEAKVETLEIIRANQSTEEVTMSLPEQKTAKETEFAHTYAQAVKAATVTTIFQPQKSGQQRK